ncbi:MAG: heterodisulfide reductase-related iron-sulfur binding cluster, partial [Nitrolancea sp.]
IKTEYLAQYYDANGVPLRSRIFGNIHLINRLGSMAAPLANAATRGPLARFGKQMLGVHPDREIAPFAKETFEEWFQGRRDVKPSGKRGLAVFFHDTFVNYNYPEIGIAAVELLEAAGYSVEIVERRACCGRPMLSKGLVEGARKLARQNVEALMPYARQGVPIIGTEPSCILTLRDEYPDLLPDSPDVERIANNSFMIDEFLAKQLDDGTLDIAWSEADGPHVLFHGHCHQKALIGMGPSMSILRAAGCVPAESGAGCCGMAGSFGYETEHYEVSRKVGAERLFPKVEEQSRETVIAVTGVSCREQIGHFTKRRPVHIAEVLASRLTPAKSASRTLEQAAD